MVIRKLVTVLGYKVDKKGLREGEASLSNFASRGKLIFAGVAAAGVAAVGMLGKSVVSAAAETESLMASYEVMLGSAEKAKKLYEDIDKMSLKTPFEPDVLNEAAKTMLNFGIESGDVLTNLQRLGDVAGTDKEKLKGLTLAFSQMSATGKLMGQDLLQMINAGFNPLREISRTTGKSISVLKDEMSKGAISADMVSEAFRTVTAEGGMFFGNMDKQSKTFNGRLSTLLGFITKIKQEIGKRFLGSLGDGLEELNGWLEKKLIPNIDKWLMKLDPVFQFVDAIRATLAEIPSILSAINTMFEPEIQLVKNLAVSVWDAVSAAWDFFAALSKTEAAMAIIEGLSWVVTTAIEGWIKLFDLVAEGYRKLTTLFDEKEAGRREKGDDSLSARYQRGRRQFSDISGRIAQDVAARRDLRIQNFNIKQTNNIKAPAAKDGTTGLSADGLAKVNQESSKALFAMQLSRLTYASTGA